MQLYSNIYTHVAVILLIRVQLGRAATEPLLLWRRVELEVGESHE